MGNFTQLLSKEGENLSHYVHSFETSRDSTTNLKESKWAAAATITGVVRSQPEGVVETLLGVLEGEVLIILTSTQAAEHDVIAWQSKYYDVVAVEEMYFRKTLEYYKVTCMRRIEFLGN